MPWFLGSATINPDSSRHLASLRYHLLNVSWQLCAACGDLISAPCHRKNSDEIRQQFRFLSTRNKMRTQPPKRPDAFHETECRNRSGLMPLCQPVCVVSDDATCYRGSRRWMRRGTCARRTDRPVSLRGFLCESKYNRYSLPPASSQAPPPSTVSSSSPSVTPFRVPRC